MTNETDGKSTREMVVELTVSAAVQENKLDTVIAALKERNEKDDKWHESMNARVRTVEVNLGKQEECLKHAIRNITGFNAIYATITAGIAALIGRES